MPYTAPIKPNLRAIKRRLENASAGDWSYRAATGFMDVTQVRTRTEHTTNDPENPVAVRHTVIAEYASSADAEFMVHAHTDIPLLLADIEDWRKLTEKQLLQIALVAGERDRLQGELDYVRRLLRPEPVKPATPADIAPQSTDLGELVPTWPCMHCGADIKFRDKPVPLGGAVFQHLDEPEFPHFPVRAPGDSKLRKPAPSTTPIEGEAQ